LLLITRSE